MQNIGKFSDNSRINIVIENILDELCPFLEEQAREISELTAIGKALGTGKDIRALLKMILLPMRFRILWILTRLRNRQNVCMIDIDKKRKMHLKKSWESKKRILIRINKMQKLLNLM
ncbi:MAG: hypothetical protein A2464_04670 [Deltaproteobacteria bacterium RIFOXYC2_FULL_48_10]|nr:MAG: hypothetical protein A2464_04670 [Deltaproteobacteria bacterium RIFOXYC2_FULL_48_10]